MSADVCLQKLKRADHLRRPSYDKKKTESARENGHWISHLALFFSYYHVNINIKDNINKSTKPLTHVSEI